MTTQFDIERLRGVKLIKTKFPKSRDSKNQGRIVTSRIRRSDLMYRFEQEAERILDRGRGGIRGRQTQSSRFDAIEWTKSFVKLRISQLPKKAIDEKMFKKAKHLVLIGIDAESIWHGIGMLESYIVVYKPNIFKRLAILELIDAAAAKYWWMMDGRINSSDVTAASAIRID